MNITRENITEIHFKSNNKKPDFLLGNLDFILSEFEGNSFLYLKERLKDENVKLLFTKPFIKKETLPKKFSDGSVLIASRTKKEMDMSRFEREILSKRNLEKVKKMLESLNQ